MPFRRAPLAIMLLLASTVLAFWPDYYGVLRTAPVGFHLHGVTASVWLLLMAAQSRTANNRQLVLHRLIGRASVWYFPLLTGGMGAVVHSMAAATPASPFYAMHGAPLGFLDLSSLVMVAWLFARALAERRAVQAHARYMIATILFLISPIVGRLAGHHLPPLMIHGPQDFWRFTWSVQIGNLVALALACWLYRAAPRHGRAFATSALVLFLQTLLFPIVDQSAFWVASFRAIGTLPLGVVVAAGAVLGAVAAGSGWLAGGASGATHRIRPA